MLSSATGETPIAPVRRIFRFVDSSNRKVEKFSTMACLAMVLGAVGSVFAEPETADWKPSVRWRGFNLLGMFRAPGDTSDHRAKGYFTEEEFRWIHDWGFNFVRLPMDYRHWIKDGDWNRIDETAFERLDRCIDWGEKYGIHVQFCFHRAPGYTILSWEKKEPKDLRTDDEPLEAFARQWAFFAKRYRDIPNEQLSFNLFNEPSSFTDERYEKVVRTLVAAIRREDPKRFIVADGIACCARPLRSVFDLKGVGQASRGYAPHTISHYGVFYFPEATFKPVWPLNREVPFGGALTGPGEKGHDAITIADAPAGQWEFSFGRVDGRVEIAFTADGVSLTNAVLKATGSVFVTVPTGVKTLEIRNVRGKLAVLGSLFVTAADGKRAKLGTWIASGGYEGVHRNRNFRQRFVGFDAEPSFRAADATGPFKRRYETIGEDFIAEFCSFAAWDDVPRCGVYSMVGEFGCRATTPIDVVLAMTEDQLRYWKRQNWGWALWNLVGYCGVLDNGRTDAPQEDFHGHKLDRQLLELLRRW